MPKISVIVPVYNKEKYLEKCLDSLVNQTFKDYEIIIVDDGSTDNSSVIIEKYSNKYNCLINYYYIEHSGVSFSRNYGIKKASGDFFIFVDSDDYLELNLLEILNNYLIANPNVDMIKYKMKVITENNNEGIPGPIFSKATGEQAFNILCFKDVLIDSPCIYLIKTSLFKSTDLRFLENTYHEDFGLMPLLIVSSKSFISIDFYGYNYYKSENSIMRNNDYKKTLKKAEDLFLHYNNMIEFTNKNKLEKITIINLKQYYTNAILLSLKTLKPADKKLFIRKIKEKKLINNIKPRNIKQIIKKLLLYIFLKIK